VRVRVCARGRACMRACAGGWAVLRVDYVSAFVCVCVRSWVCGCVVGVDSLCSCPGQERRPHRRASCFPSAEHRLRLGHAPGPASCHWPRAIEHWVAGAAEWGMQTSPARAVARHGHGTSSLVTVTSPPRMGLRQELTSSDARSCGGMTVVHRRRFDYACVALRLLFSWLMGTLAGDACGTIGHHPCDGSCMCNALHCRSSFDCCWWCWSRCSGRCCCCYHRRCCCCCFCCRWRPACTSLW
jgi:hypothetical protein